MILDWLIVGGGIHGVHIAARLIGQANVNIEQIRIIDPNEKLLQRWKDCTSTTGMQYLRSPSVHNLDIDPWALLDKALEEENQGIPLFSPPYDRPSLEFFNDHCNEIIARYQIDELHIQAKAESCSLESEFVMVEIDNGQQIAAKNVVFAMGAGDQPTWPEWSKIDSEKIHHIFSDNFDALPNLKESVSIIGGGISAGQVALRLAKDGHEVTLVTRHELREHQFDSDPGWLGPMYMDGYSKIIDVNKRRKLITKARHKGSMSPDVIESLNEQIAQGNISWHIDDVDELIEDNEQLVIKLESGEKIIADRILLATGFEGNRPGGELITQLIESASLPCAKCGYPIVDQTLCWHPGIYVSGPLAELELGPVSRNISGARRAADRIVSSLIGNMAELY